VETIAGLLDLFVKISVDDNASNKIGNISKKATTAFSKIGNVAGAGMKLAAKGATVAAGAIATLSTMAVKTYSNYEQLVGGVETLFGAGGKSLVEYVNAVGKYSPEISAQYNDLMAAQNKVMADADEAYKTAGLSANDYMETVTSFAAALNSSLGGNTQKSAEYANMAVIDMADNANKMGSSMESIQNAYQGFAKQNYTMLDNLKLGYGGTKTEMERLLADASKISGKKFDLSSYADVVEAIHTIQTEMGITGTTAEEAEHTISGSANAMKAAWTNWLTGLGNSKADIGKLTTQLIDSAKTVLANVMPVVRQVLTTLGDVISNDAPAIIEEGLSYILDAAPQLLEMGGQLISSLVDGIIANLPQILSAATQLITMLCNGIMESASQIPEAVTEIITQLVNFIVANAPQLLVAGVTLVLSLIQGLIKAIPDIIQAIPQLIDGIVSAFDNASSQILGIGRQIVQDIIDGISSAWDGLVSWFNGLWDSLFGGRSVSVGVSYEDGSHSGLGGHFAIGTDYVPYNGMPAILHRGEAVLNAYEADQWRRGRGRGNNQGITIVQNIQSVPQTPIQLAAATQAMFEQARWAL
jgi:hypothetical protein